MNVCRQSIIAEVENSLAAQYAAMPQEELHQWHATLQHSLSESSDAHHKAKDYLKQVSLLTSCGVLADLFADLAAVPNSQPSEIPYGTEGYFKQVGQSNLSLLLQQAVKEYRMF